jgi:hypothetical protein
VSANIAFLEELREDLLDAGWRESLPSGRRVRSGRAGRPFGGRWLVAVAAVFGLIAVTGVGLLATGIDPVRMASSVTGGDGAGTAPADSPRREPAPAAVADQSAALISEEGWRADLAEPTFGEAESGDQAAVRGVSVGDLALIVKTGRLSIVVERDTFATRMQDAMDVAVSNDGYVQSTTTQGDRFGSLVIRVPSDRFETTIRELKELGTKVEAQTISGDDVTAEYVDLRARLHIAKARRVVLERLMNKAVSIEQTIRVQNALDDVQLRIEQYQGSMNVLEDKVTEATIRLQIREPGVQPLERKVENPSIPGAFDRAVAGFFSVIAGAVIGLGYLIPVLVLGVALFFAIRFARRRLA